VSGRFALDDGEAIGARVNGERLAGDSYARGRLVDVEFVRCDLTACDFSEGAWQRVKVVDCRCTGIDLSQLRLHEVTFTDCKLDNANVRLSKLDSVRFQNCVCTGADFVAAQLEKVAFAGSDLAGANFSQVRCVDVDLRDARLDGLQGVASLSGTTIAVDQLFGFAPALAHALGITVSTEEPAT
jgi:uncharacterized protein YjbI with pentapeptide repeats